MSASDANEAAAEGRTAAPVRARSRIFLAARRTATLSSWTLWCYVAYLALRLGARGDHAKWAVATARTHHWFRGCLRMLRIPVRTTGAMPQGPALIAPNHLGYMDIAAIGAVIPTFFVSKADVESWPIIGFLFRSTCHVGVSRAGARGVQRANDQVESRLRAGFPVCVFLEGTSTGGGEVLPFHASLLQPAVDADFPVVPTSIRWRAEDDAVDVAEDVAYWKDHTLVPHLWRLLGLNGISVDIHFGDPIPVDGRDRKELARVTRDSVVEGLARIAGDS